MTTLAIVGTILALVAFGIAIEQNAKEDAKQYQDSDHERNKLTVICEAIFALLFVALSLLAMTSV